MAEEIELEGKATDRAVNFDSQADSWKPFATIDTEWEAPDPAVPCDICQKNRGIKACDYNNKCLCIGF